MWGYLTSNGPIKSYPYITDRWMLTIFTRIFHPIPSWLNWPVTLNGPDVYNTIAWQTLFAWLWRWLPLRSWKRQSTTAFLLKTNLTRTITKSDESFLGLDNTTCCLFYRNMVHDSQSCHQDLCICECKKCNSSNWSMSSHNCNSFQERFWAKKVI